jgi:hypothetical protein
MPDPEIAEMEEKLQESLGTRVHIERKENGGYITIDFFTNDDLHTILSLIKSTENKDPNRMLDKFASSQETQETTIESKAGSELNDLIDAVSNGNDNIHLIDDRTNEEIKKAEEEVDLYNIKNFSI